MFELESNVRSYCHNFPGVFESASGTTLKLRSGEGYLDFLSGCGTLNYGHNQEKIRDALIQYISNYGIAHGLDLETSAKEEFLKTFHDLILSPRELNYKIQFPGPTGTNAVEAALKLARKYTGRSNVIAFSNAFHGCTLGALSLTANSQHRGQSQPLLQYVTRWPFENYFGSDVDTAEMLDRMLQDPSGGIDPPAAIIVETVQGEGGLSVASPDWIRSLRRIADRTGAVLIVDDIQAGCGRTGKFFSFEHVDVEPDIVVMAKAISGFGLPMSLLLMRPGLDVWQPGEHNGTFRGNNHAFVTAAAALKTFWQSPSFEAEIAAKSEHGRKRLGRLANENGFSLKGRGLFLGLETRDSSLTAKIQRGCFERGLIIETCGPYDSILKFLPPLTVTVSELEAGFEIVDQSIRAARAYENSIIAGAA